MNHRRAHCVCGSVSLTRWSRLRMSQTSRMTKHFLIHTAHTADSHCACIVHQMDISVADKFISEYALLQAYKFKQVRMDTFCSLCALKSLNVKSIEDDCNSFIHLTNLRDIQAGENVHDMSSIVISLVKLENLVVCYITFGNVLQLIRDLVKNWKKSELIITVKPTNSIWSDWTMNVKNWPVQQKWRFMCHRLFS